jgi:hypothetical protein
MALGTLAGRRATEVGAPGGTFSLVLRPPASWAGGWTVPGSQPDCWRFAHLAKLGRGHVTF